MKHAYSILVRPLEGGNWQATAILSGPELNMLVCSPIGPSFEDVWSRLDAIIKPHQKSIEEYEQTPAAKTA